MLVGTEMAAAIALLDPYPIDVARHQLRDRPARDGRARAPARPDVPQARSSCYPERGPAAARRRQAALSADARGARRLARCASSTRTASNIVGGCCGTTPAHLAAVVRRSARARRSRASPRFQPQVSSIYARRAARAGQLDPARRRAHERERHRRRSASTCSSRRRRRHGRDGPRAGARRQPRARRVHRLRRPRRGRRHDAASCTRYRTDVPVPLMIDSTEAPVLEAALKLVRRALRSSTRSTSRTALERCEKVLPLAKEHGAAVDRADDRRSRAWPRPPTTSCASRKRIYEICVEDYGLRPEDLLFDSLTFTICTGNEDDRRLGARDARGHPPRARGAARASDSCSASRTSRSA